MTSFRTHYDNLKIVRDAPPEIIKAAYKTLAQRYHPDRNPGDKEAERIMQLINGSYDVLSDPDKRAQHDQWIAEQEAAATESVQRTVVAQQPFSPFAQQHASHSHTPPPNVPPFIRNTALHLLRFRPLYSTLIIAYFVWNVLSSFIYANRRMAEITVQQPQHYSIDNPASAIDNHASENAARSNDRTPLGAMLQQLEDSTQLQSVQLDVVRARRSGMNDDLIYIQLIYSQKWKRLFERWKQQGLSEPHITKLLRLNLDSPPDELRQHLPSIDHNFFDQRNSMLPSVGMGMTFLNSPWLTPYTQPTAGNHSDSPNIKGERMVQLMKILTSDEQSPLTVRERIMRYQAEGRSDMQIYKNLVERSPFTKKIAEAHQQGFKDTEIAPLFGLSL